MDTSGDNQISKMKLDKLNNNVKCNETDVKPTINSKLLDDQQLEYSRSRELMSKLCATNPQFTASVLEDYIRPIFKEGDVVLEVECGSNNAVM